MNSRSKSKGTQSGGKKRAPKSPAQVPITSAAAVKISSTDPDHTVLRDRITVLLNQLKLEKLDITVHKLKSMPFNSEGKLKALVKAVFEKAVNNVQKGEVYAKLCQQLSAFQVISAGSECVCFKHLLVEHSRQEFQICFPKNGNDALQQWCEKMDAIGFRSPTSRSGPPLTDLVKLKKMSTVMFLGQLFKAQFLTVNIMRVVISRLFSLVDEDVWNCLCSLLLLIGSDMEAKKQDLARCLMKMQEMVSKRQLSESARNQLKRVIECRRNKWRQTETVCSEYSFNLQRIPPQLYEDHEDCEDYDAWAMGTLSHVVFPRRVLRNQMRQAKYKFNQV
jgi:hypothetical protein